MKKFLIVACLLLCLSSLNAAIVHVPSQQPTIQAGIDLANPGDTVMVAGGTYSGDGNRDLDFGGKNIAVLSELGPLGVFINCEGTEAEPHRAFWIHSGEDETALISGFTITGAYAPEWDNAAVLFDYASPTINNCIIENNVGTGVKSHRGSLTMSDCVIRGNSGYGVWIDESPAIIAGCEISSNYFYGVFWHAQWYGYEFEMWNCLVRDNDGWGLNMLIGSGRFHVYNCTFFGNTSGVVYDWDFPKAAESDAPASIDVSTIENNIMAFNSEYGLVSHIWAGDVEVNCNNAFGNGIEDFHEVGVGPGDPYGNISEDPMFCDPPSHDYTLQEGSPCLPENNECGVLMGAFDLGCSCCVVRGDFNHDGALDPSDMIDPDLAVPSFIGWQWLGGAGPPCMEEADANGDGDVNPVDIVYMVHYLWKYGPPPVPCD